jgi:hypothetical protein
VITAAEEQPMTGAGPLIRPLTPADRPALAAFPDRVSAGSAISRFHGSVTMLTGLAQVRASPGCSGSPGR